MNLGKPGKGQLIVGMILILISFGLGAKLWLSYAYYPGLLIWFFGVLGGVASGRYIESIINTSPNDK